MNIINSSLPLPHLTSNMVDFEHINVDEGCGDMMVSFDLLVNDNCSFDGLFELLHNQMRHNRYLLPYYEVESEFEDSLNRSLRLVITMNDYGNYEFNLFNFAGEDYTSIQIDLANDEIDLFKPYMYKYFEPSYQLEQIRGDVEKSVNNIIPIKKLVGMRLVSDRIVNGTYKAAWMGENNNRCIICELANYTEEQCPVIITKFGF